jgi:hypothetical protein
MSVVSLKNATLFSYNLVAHYKEQVVCSGGL